MASRIKKDAVGLRDQLTQAIAGATALGLGWPSQAPSIATMTAARDDIDDSITDTDAKKAAWQVAGQLKGTRVDVGFPIMVKVDEVTTVLYGRDGAEKNSFGIVPEGAPMEPLHKLIEIVFTDGPVPGSLKADWEPIDGASYEVQWASTADFATVLGSATSASASDYIISGLVPGTQYWMRVRPIRGGVTEMWSDPATRIAPV